MRRGVRRTARQAPGEEEAQRRSPRVPPHTLQRASSTTLLQPAVEAVLGSQVLKDTAAMQHNTLPLDSQSLMYRPLARRVVKTQIQLPAQHERSTLTKPEQLQLSQQPVCSDTPSYALSGIAEHEGLVSVPTMLCYPPPRSFVHLVGDSLVEQTVVDSQRNIAVRCAPQATVVAKSAQVKKPNKCLCIKRESCCC